MKNVREASLSSWIPATSFLRLLEYSPGGPTDARIPNDPPVCRTREFIPLYVAPVWGRGGGEELASCFHKYYRRILVDGKNYPPLPRPEDESRVAIRVVVSFVRILLQILLQIRGVEMLSVD